ncbi:MAG: class I SAM-dependent methyltransferase [Acidimicrobiales bacterium]
MAIDSDWGASFASATTDAMAIYDDVFVPRLFEPWAELLLDMLAVPAGASLLDVATGPGSLARLAAQRVTAKGRVTGCDLSPAMLTRARAKPVDDDAAPITYLECPADRLDVDDGAFDFVTCQQGLQFFPDRPAALREMRRALRPGGRLGVAVWHAIDACPPFERMAATLDEVLGPDVGAAYRSGPWGLPDGDEVAALVTAAGFTDVRVTGHALPVTFEGGPPQFATTLAAAAVAAQVAALDDAGRARLARVAREQFAPLVVDGVIHSSMASSIVLATA